MTYRLATGFTVHVISTSEYDQFETRNTSGDTISIVQLAPAGAAIMHATLTKEAV